MMLFRALIPALLFSQALTDPAGGQHCCRSAICKHTSRSLIGQKPAWSMKFLAQESRHPQTAVYRDKKIP